MLNTPPLKPSATARPVRIYGVAATPVSLRACHDPHMPASNPPYASSTLAPLAQMRPAPRSKATPTAMRGVRLAVQCCSCIRNPRSYLCALVHEPPDLFRFKGHFQMRYPKGSQGINDGTGHCLIQTASP